MGLIDVISSRVTKWEGLCGVSHQIFMLWGDYADEGNSGK